MAIVGSLVGIYYLVVAQHRHALVSLRTKLHCALKEAENKMHYSFYLGDCGSVESMFHLERRNKENKEEKKEERKKQKRGREIKTREGAITLFAHNGLELGYIEKKRGHEKYYPKCTPCS